MVNEKLILIFFFAALTFSLAKTPLPLVGTGDGIELFRALSTAYNEEHREVELKVPPSIGSGGGIGAVISGQAQIGRVARQLKKEEIEKGLRYLPLATIPTVFFIHKGLRMPTLSSRLIADIYQGHVRNWQELGGAPLKIRIVRRENGDSSLEALRRGLPLWKNLEITERTKTATSTQEAIETVHVVEGTIGFGPYSSQLSSLVTVLKLDGVAPLDANYPAFVEIGVIYMLLNPNPEIQSFLTFLKTKKAQEIITHYGAMPVKN
jgi:phosphate transport system substrate-binding protein